MHTPSPSTSPHPAPGSQGLPARAGEYLAFRLGAEEYAIDILQVQEIRSHERPTRMAGVPQHVLGVINLRGVIVPVIDLRLRLGQSNPVYDAFTSVIVLNLGTRVVGVVVDSVSDVLTLAAEQLRPAPEFASAPDARHVLGIGTVAERMLILVDASALVDAGASATNLH